MKSKKIISMILATVTALSLCLPAFAAFNPEDQTPTEVTASSSYKDDTIILGRIQPGEGTLIVTDEPNMMGDGDIMPFAANSRFLFSAEATNVKNIVTTRASNKVITRETTKGDIRVSGTLTYSPDPSESQSRAIRTGLCTYNATYDRFETSPSLYLLFENGAHNSHVINGTAMKASRNYYGFIRNLIEDNVHKVNGTVYYYDDYD